MKPSLCFGDLDLIFQVTVELNRVKFEQHWGDTKILVCMISYELVAYLKQIYTDLMLGHDQDLIRLL